MNSLYLVATKTAVMGSFPQNNFVLHLIATKTTEMDPLNLKPLERLKLTPLNKCSYLEATKKAKVHGRAKNKATFFGLPCEFNI